MRSSTKAHTLGSHERAHHLCVRRRRAAFANELETTSSAASETSSDATEERRNRRELLGFSWRSWRPLRDAGDRHLDNLSCQERRGRKERQARCSVALGVKKRVLMRSVLPRERTVPIVCDVDVGVSNTASETQAHDATAGRFTPYGADRLRPRQTAAVNGAKACSVSSDP